MENKISFIIKMLPLILVLCGFGAAYSQYNVDKALFRRDFQDLVKYVEKLDQDIKKTNIMLMNNKAVSDANFNSVNKDNMDDFAAVSTLINNMKKVDEDLKDLKKWFYEVQ